ncbi:hypothetical protein [Brucella anthropi]|nr:hypothetical protein [Brucella anthropi]
MEVSRANTRQWVTSASAKATCATGLHRHPPVSVTFRRVITVPCRATY